MYWWSIDAKQTVIMDEVGIASEATGTWGDIVFYGPKLIFPEFNCCLFKLFSLFI